MGSGEKIRAAFYKARDEYERIAMFDQHRFSTSVAAGLLAGLSVAAFIEATGRLIHVL